MPDPSRSLDDFDLVSRSIPMLVVPDDEGNPLATIYILGASDGWLAEAEALVEYRSEFGAFDEWTSRLSDSSTSTLRFVEPGYLEIHAVIHAVALDTTFLIPFDRTDAAVHAAVTAPWLVFVLATPDRVEGYTQATVQTLLDTAPVLAFPGLVAQQPVAPDAAGGAS